MHLNLIKEEHRTLVWLGIIILAGVLLRFYNLASQSLWYDESATYVIASSGIEGAWNAMASGGEFNPPLFYWLEYIVTQTLGATNLTLRLIPFIAGVLAVPAIYLLGEEMVDKRLGLVAALFMAISPWAISYSQEARAYSLAVLFYIITLIYFFRMMHSRRGGNFFGLFAALTVWTHFFSIIFVGPLIFALFLNGLLTRCSNDRTLAQSVLATILMLPLLPAFYSMMTTYTESGIGALLVAEESGIPGLGYFNIFYALSGYNPMTMVFVVVAIAVSLYLYATTDIACCDIDGHCTTEYPYPPYFLYAFFTPIIISVFLYYSGYIAVMPRYMSCLHPLLMIFLAIMSLSFLNRKGEKYITFVAIFMIVLMSALSLGLFYIVPVKPAWEDGADYLRSVDHPGDNILIISGHYSWHPFRFYYDNATEGTYIYGATNYEGFLNHTDSKYFILSEGEMRWIDPTNQTYAWLDSHNTTMRQFYGYGIYTKV